LTSTSDDLIQTLPLHVSHANHVTHALARQLDVPDLPVLSALDHEHLHAVPSHRDDAVTGFLDFEEDDAVHDRALGNVLDLE